MVGCIEISDWYTELIALKMYSICRMWLNFSRWTQKVFNVTVIFSWAARDFQTRILKTQLHINFWHQPWISCLLRERERND